MEQLIQQIEDYKREIEHIAMNGAASLEEYRIKFLGTKGIVKSLFGEMKNVEPDKKKEFGQVLNEFKQFAEAKYESWQSIINSSSPAAGVSAGIDLSLPGDPLPLGSQHPISPGA